MASLNSKTPAMVLQEFSTKHNFGPPQYVLVVSKSGTHVNEFHYEVTVAGVRARGFGRSKQVAKHDAASKALEILAEEGLFDARSNPIQGFHAQSHRNESDSPDAPCVNYIGTLKDFCCENKLPTPLFTEISDVGPAHCREFTYLCSLASIKTQTTAKTKKQAKQLAAREMLERIKDVFPNIPNMQDYNAIMDTDSEAIAKYSELTDDITVTPNRAVPLEERCYNIMNLMGEKGLTFNDFSSDFTAKDEQGLHSAFGKLGLQCKLGILQEDPFLAYFTSTLDTPFTIIGVGQTEAEATSDCIRKAYENLQVFMTIPGKPEDSRHYYST